MPIALTEDEMTSLLNHLRLVSRVSCYRDDLQDVQADDGNWMFGDDEGAEEDREREEEEVQDLYDMADAALQNSGYIPADAFSGTQMFNNLCTQTDIWTMGHGAPLPRAKLRELVEKYLSENP
jgi:hypothetical protein